VHKIEGRKQMVTTQSNGFTERAIRNVTVAGTGVLGAQIAFQVAFHDFNVIAYDINDAILEKARARFKGLQDVYRDEMRASHGQVDAAYSRIAYSADLATAAKEADLVIEAVPETMELKKSFYSGLAEVAPAATIFASNSSTMLPSQLAEFSGRPERFLNLHFANQVWKHNIAEIMGHPGTDQRVFAAVVDFAKTIGMVPLPLNKEQPGYLLNSLLIPELRAALALLVNEVADVHTIDKTWMISMEAKRGPFAILDGIGIATAYNINKNEAATTRDPTTAKIAEYLKVNFVDAGKLGVATGEGFYKYPNPEYLRPDFVK
jgi:3-hydroxyacyl-CoA dehydrogenase